MTSKMKLAESQCVFQENGNRSRSQEWIKVGKKGSWRRHGAIPVLSLMAHSTCTPLFTLTLLKKKRVSSCHFLAPNFSSILSNFILVHEIFDFFTSFPIKLQKKNNIVELMPTILLLCYKQVPNDEMKIHIEKDKKY